MLPDTEPAKLLIVDDLPENLLALEALIRGDLVEVYKAQSAEQALELLLCHEFALAILDVQMPDMDGFQLAEMMRGAERTRHIPIVFVSAAGRELNYAFKGYESGAVDFLQKPLDSHTVRSKVNVFVELYLQRKALRQQLSALERARQEQELLLAELRRAQGELQRAVRMRDDFMSVVSHELKTPLNTLILEVQLRRLYLERGNLAAFAPEKLGAMVEKDERQIRNLIRLIDDMLDVSRIRTGKLSIRRQPMDLAALVGAVAESFASQLEQAGIELYSEIHGPVPGEWDEFRIEQVVANLLTNAMRYGGGKPITVRVQPVGGDVLLEVEDRGQGISEEDQARIFTQFERGSRGGEQVAGLGLGLFIADQIVRAHGGTLSVRSRLGEGSVFSVMLPRKAGASGAESSQALAARSS
jgi:signal transduction histidine kinase